MKRRKKQSIGVAAAAAVCLLLIVGDRALVNFVRNEVDLAVVVNDDSPTTAAAVPQERGANDGGGVVAVAPARPMREIRPFDDDAMDWSNIFAHYNCGLVVFDANGDDRPDVYFCQDGDNWTRPTNEQGVLADEPRYQHNALYLNQGNDADGNPVYVQIDKLAGANDTHVRAELLVENYLYPRDAVTDPVKRTARKSAVAAAADFNNDGNVDLLVGNCLPGMFWSHPKTQRVLARFVAPTGRQARHSKIPMSGLGSHLVRYAPRDNTDDRRPSARSEEMLAANSLFVNLGDRDGDGIPEWQDVSRETGIEGKRHTVSIAVADIDLDGDLDVYEANIMDLDFWPGGAKGWAGAANCLYINQLAETGEFRFVERAAAMDVDGVYDADNPRIEYYRLRKIPLLADEYSLIFLKLVPYVPPLLEINGQIGEPAQISWASVFQDVNHDGYPDLWVAEDMSRLALYINEGGKRFAQAEHVRYGNIGSWMSFAPGDLNGDLVEDIFVGNAGGGLYAHSFIAPDPYSLLDPVITDSMGLSLIGNGYYDPRHILVDGRDPTRTLLHRVAHSRVMPPDSSLPNNIRGALSIAQHQFEFDGNAIDAYEFSWGSVCFDVQNDGAPDLYFAGNLVGRAGGVFTINGTGPGRLLVNTTRPSEPLRFADLTAEHHLFNIQELQYDRLAQDGYIYRKSPLQNWAKRDTVYSYDRSVWASQGVVIQERIANHDLIQTAENGRAVVATDLNQDGFTDLILRNLGGYDTRSSSGRNLKTRRPDGRLPALPSHDHNFPVLTNYEPGSTRVFINGYTENNWLKIRLVEDAAGSFNRDAIGARVTVNGRYLRVKRATQGSHVSNWLTDLSFGLAGDAARHVRIEWPDRQQTVTEHELDGHRNGTLTISKTKGPGKWQSAMAVSYATD